MFAKVIVFMLLVQIITCYDVLMVIGGMFIDQSVLYTHRSVEVVGVNKVCKTLPPLPVPLHSHFAGRLRDRVIVCGGNDGQYERHECYFFFPNNQTWIRGPDIEDGALIFAAAGGDTGDNFFVVGGRRYSHEKHVWEYINKTMVFNTNQNRWFQLADLPVPIADACLIVQRGDLVLIGGSKARYQYADEPSKVWVLSKNTHTWKDDIFPPIIGSRLWMGCALVNLNDEAHILISGGYYNGRTSQAIPISRFLHREPKTPDDQWRYFGTMQDERQWGPSLGMVNGKAVITGGANYGDVAIDEMGNDGHWRRLTSPRQKMSHRREFSASVTVPHNWFPQCRFRDF